MNSLGGKKDKEVGEQVIAQGSSGDGVDYPYLRRLGSSPIRPDVIQGGQ